MGTKKYFLCLFMVIFGVSLASIAFAEEEAVKPHCDFTWTFYSQYIWRGFDLSKDNLVTFPSLRAGRGFHFNSWKDLDTNDERTLRRNNDTDWWKTDWIFTYSNRLNILDDTPLNWTLGWVTPDTGKGEDNEVFGILGLDTTLAPKISVWRGMEGGDSWYLHLAMSHSWDLSKRWPEVKGWTLDLGGGVSYYDIDNIRYSDFRDVDVWAGLNIPVSDWCSLSPSLNYSFPMSDGAKGFLEDSSFDEVDSHFVFGGIKLNINFK